MATRHNQKLTKKIDELQRERDKYFEFYNSVSCYFVEGVEFCTKTQLYDIIRAAWRKVK